MADVNVTVTVPSVITATAANTNAVTVAVANPSTITAAATDPSSVNVAVNNQASITVTTSGLNTVSVAVTNPAPITISASVGNSGDMMKSVYDTDNDGVVDNAEALGGVSASSYIQTGNASWVDLTDGGTTTLHSHAGGSGTVTSIATTAPITGGTITGSGTIGIDAATTLAAGSMSAGDKTKLDGLVTNATHTGDVTGSGALTIANKVTMTGTAPVSVSGSPTVIAGSAVAISMAPASNGVNGYMTGTYATKLDGIASGAQVNNISDVNATDLTDGGVTTLHSHAGGAGDVVGDDTSTTAQNIVAYTGTGGKNITELTGTQGDVLYHNGTNWAKLGAGTLGQYLKTGGAGANPSWGYGAVIHSSKSSGVTTTGANTTPVNVSGAVFDYVASAVYRIWVMGRINSTAATTGVGVQFDLSSAVTAIDSHTIHPLTTTTVNVAYSIADDTTVAPTTGVPAGPLDVPFITNALLVTGANTGTCQLRFRSETTAVTELLAGVVMVAERVA